MLPIGEIHPKSEYVLGVDFARMGQDSTVFIVIEKPFDSDILYVVYLEETNQKKLTDAIGRIINLNEKFRFAQIYLDETGIGAGPTDLLSAKLKGAITGMTFTTRSKRDIYSNLKVLMQRGKLKIPAHRKLLFQLADLRYETTDSGEIKIHHSERGHDDYTDALALAAWHYRQDSLEPVFSGIRGFGKK